jgi:ribonuclease HI
MRTLKIYTDGSCQLRGMHDKGDGLGAWGFIALLGEETYIPETKSIKHFTEEKSGIVTKTTSQRMELTAVWKALIFAIKHWNDFNDFEIYTDSRYITGAFNEGWIERWEKEGWKTRSHSTKGTGLAPVANQDLWKPIIALAKELPVKFIKVQGKHKGDSYEAQVHSLAYNTMQDEALRLGRGSVRSRYGHHDYRDQRKKVTMIRRKGREHIL